MTTLSKADYLKRYTSGHDVDKKKKKKKERDGPAKKQPGGMRIVETDAFASVASTHTMEEEEESDNELEISMLNEEIRSKAMKGSMKGAFKSTFSNIGGPEIKEEPLDETNGKGDGPTIKIEEERVMENKFQMAFSAKSKSEPTAQKVQQRDSDLSSRRETRRRHDSDSDNSPVRRRPLKEDRSPPRRRRHDSDNSPPRRMRHDTPDKSPSRRKRHDSDDQSPPRSRQRHDSGNSPPRRKRQHDQDQSPPRRKRHDSDESPPRRRQRKNSDQSPPRVRSTRDSDESPPRARRVASPSVEGRHKTLDGKIAGLQSAKDLRDESDRLRAREAKMFEEMDVSVSGRDAETRVREKQIKRGRKDKPEDIEKKEREAKKQAELMEKYKEWNKGMKQIKDKQEQLEEMARVVAGPMTRTAEDVDMNQYLKDRVYESDPMAAMIQRKNREEAIDRGDLVYPTYDKPFPPNRYGIRPGYRWDGVDRSNGFEGKLVISQNARRAVEKEIYSNSNVMD